MEAILHIGIAQFLFASLVILSKKPRHLSDFISGLWLLLMVIFLGLSLLKNIYPRSFWGELQMFPFAYTFGPFLYIYVRSLVSEKAKLRVFDSLHLFPFAIFSIVVLIIDTSVDEDILGGQPFKWNLLIYTIPALISMVVYCVWAILLLNRHKQNILNHFSYQSGRITLYWLRVISIIFTLTFIITVLSIFVNALLSKAIVNPGIFLFSGFTIFAFAISFFGIKQPVIFNENTDSGFDDPITTRYANSSLTPQLAKKYSEKLIQYMEEEKPYLTRDLNIQLVATKLEIPQHHLTQSINEHLNKNFYTLVNEYRVAEVKHRLLDPKYAHLTLLAIAHDAGFNSKSTFNMIFKKFTGLTPSQFKKQKTFGRPEEKSSPLNLDESLASI